MAKDNKTEKATPRRIKKARNEGNVAKSKELNNAFSLLIVAGLLYFFGEMFIKNTIQAFVALLKQPPKLANMESYSLLLNGVWQSVDADYGDGCDFWIDELRRASRDFIFRESSEATIQTAESSELF